MTTTRTHPSCCRSSGCSRSGSVCGPGPGTRPPPSPASPSASSGHIFPGNKLLHRWVPPSALLPPAGLTATVQPPDATNSFCSASDPLSRLFLALLLLAAWIIVVEIRQRWAETTSYLKQISKQALLSQLPSVLWHFETVFLGYKYIKISIRCFFWKVKIHETLLPSTILPVINLVWSSPHSVIDKTCNTCFWSWMK